MFYNFYVTNLAVGNLAWFLHLLITLSYIRFLTLATGAGPIKLFGVNLLTFLQARPFYNKELFPYLWNGPAYKKSE